MIIKTVKKVFGTRNERILRGYGKSVKQINEIEPAMQALSDEELQAKTAEFRSKLADGHNLDQILPEAFAVVREASQRIFGMRHFDVQLIGGMVLHFGKIAEMRTGEGKTLMSTLPAYLHALSGNGVHVVTVNDYLAERDANWMRPLFEFLGLTVGINLSNISPDDKQEAYGADITYGTNNEFGFDYLRDNMVYELEQRVQRNLSYAIIDEVDSILIDEARTPLIISGEAEQTETYYHQLDEIIPHLELQKMEEGQKEEDVPDEDKRDYTVDEKSQQAHLTELGHIKVEELLMKNGLIDEGENLYDYKNITLMHFLSAALRAHALYKKDVHYVVKDDEVVIVDEHTGRLMDGRRWSDGLHQAVEAKEGVKIQMENQTMATITFQNFFRMYDILSGMTGTADTEAFELQKIYGLEVVVVPTNKPMIRKDHPDQVYLNEKAKYKGVIEKIKSIHETKQPLLVGTASIEASEYLSDLMKKEKIPFQVLNAKHHEKEAKIIAQAGRLAAVTVATNMAGRGTDIVLGGNFEEELSEAGEITETVRAQMKEDWQVRHDKVLSLGGLCVLSTERHESRRIDNQLRGRSGRQGDPGSSYFYLSMEDNLMRIFASERMRSMMTRFGFTEEDVIENKMITGAIEKAQRRVEGYNYDMRKNLLEYDDVANDQRKVIYDQRIKLLQREDIGESITGMREDAANYLLSLHIPAGSMEDQWGLDGLEKQILEDFGLELSVGKWLEGQEQSDVQAMEEMILAVLNAQYKEKVADLPEGTQAQLEKMVLMQALDHHWKEHLAAMDHLRKGINLRSFAQKNPVQEYKKESFAMFENMLDIIGYEVIAMIARVQVGAPEDLDQSEPDFELNYIHDDIPSLVHPQKEAQGEDGDAALPFKRDQRKVGRNEPCPCGSGQKYKQCHGKINVG